MSCKYEDDCEKRVPPPHVPLPPNTTAQQDMTLAGQRRINLIWEYTQAIIALFVVLSTMAAATVMLLNKDRGEPPTIISVAFGTVVGFYFSRTNHTAIGGIGNKPAQVYEGR